MDKSSDGHRGRKKRKGKGEEEVAGSEQKGAEKIRREVKENMERN